eukprot:CAMPEP_0172525330 /NCGR_PEP_ID=MMETSP1067-20121228/357_1 /TAXON_ID=265564 ORGANISM="Thalassiosira punctigera, Strain Tpunct2005C2" /NCGR_SAMPLE_ID=MMETSP1067 /ASSEMBLY_ACC=CAM_ASM_000444 /LENGTH=106 /DNA_ID=CAMNT_0013308555 /DNA_START=246 /DNA_END=563 /DNA_ORIENTATION=+
MSPYPVHRTPITPPATTGVLKGGSKTVWGCPGGGRDATSSDHLSLAMCSLGGAVAVAADADRRPPAPTTARRAAGFRSAVDAIMVSWGGRYMRVAGRSTPAVRSFL